MIQEKIIELKEYIITQANDVEKMLDNTIKGFINTDKKALKNVIEIEEKRVNKKEIKIEKLYTDIFARYQVQAKDLRIVIMIAKMNIDLERIGDHCENIAASALELINKPLVKPLIDIPRMAEITQKMIIDSINSFVNEDVELAKDVCCRDDKVDDLNEQIVRELITFMLDNRKTIERSLHLIRIAGNIENIADLATNIAEESIYVATGKDIKHRKYKKLEK